MNEQDKAEFEGALSRMSGAFGIFTHRYIAETFFKEGMAHRDKQAAQAEPVAWIDDAGTLYPSKQSLEKYLPAGRKAFPLTHQAPAVAQPPADVVRELVEAFRQAQNALILANEKDVGPIVDTIWMPGGTSETLFDFIDEALAKAKEHGL